MAIAFATTQFQVLNSTTLRVTFGYLGSWGASAFNITFDVPFEGGSLSSVLADIKARILEHVAAVGGGPALKADEIFFSGLSDPQITGVRKGADEATTAVSFVDCAGLTFQLAPNRHYKFKFAGAYTAAAGTTGLQISVNGPASPIFMRAVGVIYTAVGTPFAGAIGAYDTPIAALASGGATPLPFEIEGTISTGAAGGAFGLRFRSEVNGSAVTILRGSFGELVAAG